MSKPQLIPVSLDSICFGIGFWVRFSGVHELLPMNCSKSYINPRNKTGHF